MAREQGDLVTRKWGGLGIWEQMNGMLGERRRKREGKEHFWCLGGEEIGGV
jgi:hypothetical protein